MSYTEMPREGVLYKDKYVEVTSDAIIVSWYVFPIAFRRTVPFSEIRQVQDATQVSDWKTKAWGMTLDFTVWWAAGWRHIVGKQKTPKGVAVDEGIAGYRDDSLRCVERNRDRYGCDVHIVSFMELFGGTLDKVACISQGKEKMCSYCGILRRNALSVGAAAAGCTLIATGHNADDQAETVLLNLFRGDVNRLRRAGGLRSELGVGLPRIKPLALCRQRDIVMYCYHNRLDYFATECPYAVTAFRSLPRTLLVALSSPAVQPTAVTGTIETGVKLLEHTLAQEREREEGKADTAPGSLGACRGCNQTAPVPNPRQKLSGPPISSCKDCGSPIMTGSTCQTCMIHAAILAEDPKMLHKVLTSSSKR
ncbi:hypothetical protein KIPB_008305 [Kipferlia bialata]|uniref:tRNA(Ile)-lysidine/2-thiocytidine synthase N-terminal domain-containing protein n=1 Tax=Kipferlia bialata TaxID=797122 RepID=A0A9K3D1B7_9EUKA|nr:hypothetical protein KIPB_008305 [Kipferlia bialata]|eukprot:g8305.t1